MNNLKVYSVDRSPSNKVEYIKACPICGQHMGKEIKGTRIYYVCSEGFCQHKELQEDSMDKHIRRGGIDDEIGILRLN